MAYVQTHQNSSVGWNYKRMGVLFLQEHPIWSSRNARVTKAAVVSQLPKKRLNLNLENTAMVIFARSTVLMT